MSRIVVAMYDGAEPLRIATSAAVPAEERLARVAAVRARLSHLDDPKRFDPQSLRGVRLDDLHDAMPAGWSRGRSESGGGWIYSDPHRLGRQIRIMPGYGAGVRRDAIVQGPYAVVSQNGDAREGPARRQSGAAMKPNTVAALIEEVDGLAAAGRVGLYEFIWALRSEGGSGNLAEWKAVARRALDALLARGDCHLVRMHWPDFDEVELPPGYQVRDEDFDDIPDDGWYLALTPDR